VRSTGDGGGGKCGEGESEYEAGAADGPTCDAKDAADQERVPGRPRPLAFTAVVLGAMLIVAAMIGLLWLPAQRVNAGTVPSVNADPPAH